MKLRTLMFFVLAPVFTVSGYLGWQDIKSLNRQAAESQTALIAAAELTVLADLVHELQKERGMSAGFVASSGRNFADALPAQRTVTDARIASFDTSLTAASDATTQANAELMAQLADLPDWRARIDRLD